MKVDGLRAIMLFMASLFITVSFMGGVAMIKQGVNGEEGIKEVKCYDKNNHEIIGVVCSQKNSPTSDIMGGIFMVSMGIVVICVVISYIRSGAL